MLCQARQAAVCGRNGAGVRARRPHYRCDLVPQVRSNSCVREILAVLCNMPGNGVVAPLNACRFLWPLVSPCK